jgi:DNA repair exonuclease SbcCD ATPase subunit
VKSTETEAGGDKEELEKKHDKLHKEVTKMDIKFRAGVEIFKAMKESLESRQQAYTRLKTHTVDITTFDFLRYMKRRQHLGRVVVDDELGELTIEVKVKGLVDPNAKAVRDLKQLSGGERSYTAISYLLAVGKHTEAPFRCMDEYDVFMDAINR